MRPRKRSIGHDVSDVDFQVTRGITQNRIHLLCAFECALARTAERGALAVADILLAEEYCLGSETGL